MPESGFGSVRFASREQIELEYQDLEIPMKRHKGLAVLDAVFVAVGLVAMVAICDQPWGDHRQHLLKALLVPIAYTILSSLVARNNLAVAASRAYLMCFMLAICTGGESVARLISQCSSVLAAPEESNVKQTVELLENAAELIPCFMLPVVVGIGIYTICSVFEHQLLPDRVKSTKSNPASTPSEVQNPIAPLAAVETVEAIQASYKNLAESIQNVSRAIASWNDRFTISNKALERLSDNANKASENLERMIANAVVTQEQSRVIARSVLEMRSVLEEFAELSAKGI
jgi:hypothetical protein